MSRPDVPPQAFSLVKAVTPAKSARGRELQRIQAEARRRAQVRRERVLKHEWAQKRLCEIFGYKRAEQWNGYVPPRADPAEDRGAQLSRANTSPHRAALMKLLQDVHRFEQTGELPQAVDSTPDDAGED